MQKKSIKALSLNCIFIKDKLYIKWEMGKQFHLMVEAKVITEILEAITTIFSHYHHPTAAWNN